MAINLNGTGSITGLTSISSPTISGGSLPGGDASAPGLTFSGDPNTGIYSPGADQIAISTNGTAAVTVDSSQRLLVGTSTSVRSGLLEVAKATADTQIQITESSDSGAGPTLRITRTRGSSLSSPAPIQDGNFLGRIKFDSYDTAAYRTGAEITAQADGQTWASGDCPGRLVFSTTADGASSPTERLYLYSNGYVRAPGVYALTTAVAADVRVDSSGYLYRSTSSIRYKKDVETLRDEYADAILNARPVWFRSLSEKDNPDWGYWGFIAEEIEQIDPRLCTYGEDEKGDPQVESVQYDRFVPHLLNLIKRQQQAIKTLEAKVAALENA